ncbi:hypothetical protein GA0115256_14087 [Streptomyces sp. DconLS]|uniref:hypothetical protein n=1 Tax=Streptomyces TaxID=1883 RepID=UPI00081DD9B3|nr:MULTISPECIES: hypothetical protein [unclassified Streptomyces]SCF99504.1 hypothetical protein GA0115256_14087 [Streptomyces sp. DconLS]
MELGIAESSVTIKTLSVNGKRMPKGIYSQLPQRSLLAECDRGVVGRPWGRVVDPKCCHDAGTSRTGTSCTSTRASCSSGWR